MTVLEVGMMPLDVEDRTHFGLWVITSQPLILGYDLTNASINKRVWPIITNPHALAVSQSFSGHPGSLVRTWLPPSAEPVPDSGFTWCVHYCPADPTQLNWETPPIGQPGPLKNNNLCIEAPSLVGANLEMRPCSGSANQTFAIDVNGSMYLANNKSAGCIVVATRTSPIVVLGGCDGINNEFWKFNNGAVCSKNDMPPVGPPHAGGPEDRGYCLAARDRTPDSPTAMRGLANMMTLWAKPQASGAVAVLVVNGDPSGTNQAVTFSLGEVNASGTVTAFDVWKQQSISGTFKGTFTTDPIAMHDSRFYIFSPATKSM